jgi:fumarate reductase subunit C
MVPTISPHTAYRPRVSTYWWLGRWPYLKFILREISSVFVAWFVLLMLIQLSALSRGPAAYAEFEGWLRNPVVIAVNALSLGFVVFHSVTWFNLAPKAMALRIGGRRLPDWMISVPNYVAWLGASAAVAWLVTRG